jgi:DinB superfamily
VESRNAERVRLRAERDKLSAADPQGLAAAWVMIEGLWSETIERARKLPEPVLHEQVNGEWSFVQTHRHLVLATDCWLRRMVKGIARPASWTWRLCAASGNRGLASGRASAFTAGRGSPEG